MSSVLVFKHKNIDPQEIRHVIQALFGIVDQLHLQRVLLDMGLPIIAQNRVLNLPGHLSELDKTEWESHVFSIGASDNRVRVLFIQPAQYFLSHMFSHFSDSLLLITFNTNLQMRE